MEHTSVEDFQNYQDLSAIPTPDPLFQHSFVGASPETKNAHFRRPVQSQDLPIDSVECDHDEDDNNVSLSGSARHSSGPDDVIFDKTSGNSSPRTSHHSDNDMSESPYGSRDARCIPDVKPSSPYTPIKHRSPFRNTSSVRAMQMDTTPPSYLTSPHSQLQYKRSTPSRSGTPRHTRSQHGAMRTPSRLSPEKKVKKEYPLILLHVTLLPANVVYSAELMADVLPGYILENWKLLREKMTDTVLERGILIPHPKEDYDLLEERLLESLELKLPRILKCGHLHVEPDEELTQSDADDDGSDIDDVDICIDCGRRIRDGRFGSNGTGNRRWDIKIFAANGLMRAGAWGAAWREMERVDVEIQPWMDEQMRRELEMRQVEEDRVREEERGRMKAEEADDDDYASREKADEEHESGFLDEQTRREIYGDGPQAYVDGLYDNTHAKKSQFDSRCHTRRGHDVPLFTLVRNYLILLAQDKRNLAIVLLAILVFFLASKPMPAHAVNSAMDNISQTPVASAADYVLSAVMPSASPAGKMTDLEDPKPESFVSRNDDESEDRSSVLEDLQEPTQLEQV
ncbi:MAG: hypothetical protein M1830_002360 [Pleopsidium flavum]|nr:MAG: hypothetical protein M1830_002360 [Pleopsidium flavum]